ncbi:MAG: PQQ-binding-like beta-propeller repeat protein [Candidatus Sabulitectum sp.]|nr:PQQ-binding-like beta-propeller repeat protein [Candidatus Sabulitectum sp.]
MFRNLISTSALFLVVYTAYGSAWPQYMHDAQNTGKTDICIQEDLSLSWTYSPPQSAPGWQWNQPSLDDDGNIYYGAGYYFLSVNPEGLLRWSVHTEYAFIGPSAVNNGFVYFPCSEGSLYAYTQDGDFSWSYPMVQPVNCGTTVGPDGTIYIGDTTNLTVTDAYLYAVNPDGSEKWTLSFAGADGFYTTPSLDPDGTKLYAAPGNFNLYALNAVTGVELWSYEYNSIFNLVYSSPAVAEISGSKYILFGDLGNMGGGHWRILDENGSERWTTSVPNSIQQSAAIDPDGYFYLASNGSVLKKIDTSGTQLWSRTFSQGYLSNPVIEGSGRVLIGTESGYLHILDQNTGSTLESFYLGPNVGSPIVGSNGEVYVLYGNNILACLEGDLSVNNEDPSSGEPFLQISRTGPTFKISIGDNSGECFIYNTSGRVVFSETIERDLYWSTADYPAGIYFVRVETNVNGEVIEGNAKLIVVR